MDFIMITWKGIFLGKILGLIQAMLRLILRQWHIQVMSHIGFITIGTRARFPLRRWITKLNQSRFWSSMLLEIEKKKSSTNNP